MNTIATDRAAVKKILTIRATARAALGMPESETCPTCGRKFDAPYRRTIGRPEHGGGFAIVEGCVDASHSGHLVSGGHNAQWHNRDAARSIRRAECDSLLQK